MADKLSSLVSQSKQLTAHLTRPELPSIHLGLDQIEQQTKRLVPTQSIQDTSKGNYLLAQAHINAPILSSQIASLNPAQTFAPLQPIHDTDISSYLRHSHEQSLISAIEEGRRETENEFYRVLEERVRKDWENRKKRIFEEIGLSVAPGGEERAGGDINAFGKSRLGPLSASRSAGRPLGSSIPPQPKQSMSMHSKMMAYDRVIVQLNAARLAHTSNPLIFNLIEAAKSTTQTSTRPTSEQFVQLLQILALITNEQPPLPPSHAQAHLLNNTHVLERAYAKAYLGDPNSPAAVELRKKIVDGSRRALEAQYWDVIERIIQSKPVDAALGGDPSLANKVRGYLSVRFYKGGRWEERLEIVSGKPLWAQMFYLVRTGNIREALQVAQEFEKPLNDREQNFVAFFQAWVESNDRVLPRQLQERVTNAYNSRIAFGPNADPFKVALFKLMAKIEPHKKSLPIVTATTEDWDLSRFQGVIERDLPLLKINTIAEYQEIILKKAASHCEQNRRSVDAIRLYHLAGANDTVMSCLARALGELLSEPNGGGDEGKQLEALATDVLKYQEGRGEKTRDADDVIKLIWIRTARESHAQGDLDKALDAIEQSNLVPMDGDIQSTSRKMDEFRAMDPAITRNLGEILELSMTILKDLHIRIKNSTSGEPDRQARLAKIRKRARAVMTFAGMQKYSLSSETYGKLTTMEVQMAH
ncbi:hypothetical protein FRC02_006703 [Tulasnella sp. 418]|nr:hypothetical protein FRC02_006703 [Tulasnella sp. 418]